jgi:hypothetical protein
MKEIGELRPAMLQRIADCRHQPVPTDDPLVQTCGKCGALISSTETPRAGFREVADRRRL